MDHHVNWMKENAFKQPLDLKVIADGPCVGIIEGRSILTDMSTITVRYILEAHSDALKVECDVDWNETNKALRYELQTGYRGEVGRFGAPFGSARTSLAFATSIKDINTNKPRTGRPLLNLGRILEMYLG